VLWTFDPTVVFEEIVRSERLYGSERKEPGGNQTAVILGSLKRFSLSFSRLANSMGSCRNVTMSVVANRASSERQHQYRKS